MPDAIAELVTDTDITNKLDCLNLGGLWVNQNVNFDSIL